MNVKYAFKTLFLCWLTAALLCWAAFKTGLPVDNILSEGAQPAPKNAAWAITLLMLAMFAFTAPFIMLLLHVWVGGILMLAALPGHGKKEILQKQIALLEKRLEKERLSYSDYRKVETLEKNLAEKKAALEKLRNP